MAETTKVVRRTCTVCQNVYKQTVITDAYFDTLMKQSDVDYSLENNIEYINKTGCCDPCAHGDEDVLE